jgi:hypothetical protein
MTKPKQPNGLQKTVQDELTKMLEAKTEPSEGRMKLVKLTIAYLAVQAKIEENEYGTFFADEPGEAGGIQAGEGEEPPARVRASRKRSNGAAGDPSLPGLESS